MAPFTLFRVTNVPARKTRLWRKPLAGRQSLLEALATLAVPLELQSRLGAENPDIDAGGP